MQLQSVEELLAGIRRWVEIESQTADQAGVNRMMDDVEGLFRESGARVERIAGSSGFGDCVSVSSPWGGEGHGDDERLGDSECRGILVLCHLDTVHPKGTLKKLPFRIEGDKAYGPGIYDMKGGAYLAFAAYQSLVREGKQTPLPIRFLFVSDEEIGSLFSRPLTEKAGEQAKYVLVTEPARAGGNAVTARKGTARYQIAAHGRSSHSGTHHPLGRSAIKEISHQVLALEALTDYERDLTFNVGQVHGGLTDNTIPEHCVARLDVRVATMDDFEYADRAVRSLQPHDPDVRLEVTGRLNRPPYRKTSGIQALFDHTKALAAEIEFDIADEAAGGGSDGSFLAAKVPTLDGIGVCGAGAHTLDEHLEISSLRPRLMLMRRLMETLE